MYERLSSVRAPVVHDAAAGIQGLQRRFFGVSTSARAVLAGCQSRVRWLSPTTRTAWLWRSSMPTPIDWLRVGSGLRGLRGGRLVCAPPCRSSELRRSPKAVVRTGRGAKRPIGVGSYPVRRSAAQLPSGRRRTAMPRRNVAACHCSLSANGERPPTIPPDCTKVESEPVLDADSNVLAETLSFLTERSKIVLCDDLRPLTFF
jgi:hypothetical protein